MSLIVVAIQDQVDVSDVVTREPNRIDVLIQDVIAVSDLVVLPRMTAIDSFEPAHIRAGDSVVIKGQGFATSTGQNAVTFNGFAATVTAAAEDELTVTAPGLLAFTENGYAIVEVASPPGNATKGRAHIWVKWSTIEEEADEILPLQEADRNEVIGVDRPRLAEAEDFNKLQTLVEHSQTGGAEARAGGFKARDSVGLVRVSRRNAPNNANTGGESLVIDPSEPGLLSFGWQLDDVLAFGGLFGAGDSGLAFLRANADANGVLNLVETEQVAMLDGVIDLVWFLVKSGGADFITETQLHVEGAPVFTDFNNFGNDAVAVFRPNEPVSKGDRIELRVNKFGATVTISCVGGVRVRYS